MNEDFEELEDYEDDEEDLIERKIRIWNSTDYQKYLSIFEANLSGEERSEIYLYLIDNYYPGSANLRDDELVRQKYCSSLHQFQYMVSVKRMFEITGRGSAIPDMHSWTFVCAGEGL